MRVPYCSNKLPDKALVSQIPRKSVFGFSAGSDTNQAVLPQKMAGPGLTFRI